MLGLKRFRQDEEAVEPVDEAESCGDPERQPRVDVSGEAADGRAEHEADAERAAQQSVRLRAVFRRVDVGDVRVGGREVRGRDAREDAPGKQPPEVRRERHDRKVDRRDEARDQDHRTPPDLVGEHAEQRRTDELAERPHGRERALIHRGVCDVAAEEVRDELRQHGRDDPDREHVDRHQDEDEDGRAATRRSIRLLHRIPCSLRREKHYRSRRATARRRD